MRRRGEREGEQDSSARDGRRETYKEESDGQMDLHPRWQRLTELYWNFIWHRSNVWWCRCVCDSSFHLRSLTSRWYFQWRDSKTIADRIQIRLWVCPSFRRGFSLWSSLLPSWFLRRWKVLNNEQGIHNLMHWTFREPFCSWSFSRPNSLDIPRATF